MKKYLYICLALISGMPSVLQAQDDKYSVFDITEISRQELLAIGYNEELTLDRIALYLPWEKSSNTFEDKRNKTSAIDEFKELASNPKYKRIAIFNFYKLPITLSEFDFKRMRYSLCLPHEVMAYQDGISNLRLGVRPAFPRVTAGCSAINIESPGTLNMKIPMSGTEGVALPMPTEQMAEELHKISKQNQLFIDVECIKNEKSSKPGVFIMTCSPYRIHLFANNRKLARINWAYGELDYEFEF
jgi:hypothetical protein